MATLPAAAPPDLVALDADTGERRWCATLGDGRGERAATPFATQILDDGSVVVLRPGPGDRERVTRLDGRDGSRSWSRTLDADAGDFLGDVGATGLLLGGRARGRAVRRRRRCAERPDGNALVLLDDRDGSTIWTRTEPRPARTCTSSASTPTARTAFVQATEGRRASGRLVAFDPDGDHALVGGARPGAAFDVTLRGGPPAGARRRPVCRRTTPRTAAGCGRAPCRARPQFLPYGFELDAVPLLDADHAADRRAPTALHTLDLRNGAMTSAALPTDGISTTYWPYEVVVSRRLIGVATNTGAVVVRRE